MQWTEKRRKKQTASRRNVRYIENRADRKQMLHPGTRKAKRRAGQKGRHPAKQQGVFRADQGERQAAGQREARLGSQTVHQTGVRKAVHCARKGLGDLTGARTTEKRAPEESRVSREGEEIQRRRDSRKGPGLM